MLKILVPSCQGICNIAAQEFSSLWEKVTGQHVDIINADEPSCDLVVMGSDAVNPLSHAKIIDKVIPQFSLGIDTDDYQLISGTDTNGRTLLFLAGARPRAILYAVYRFFELRADCRYFWDGDITPHADSIDITGLNLVEKPRFSYRGLRYFAHRSLNRFQAEHWDFPQWKQEIDWILKKRMNLFMLRIGIDDLFQKTFPEIVDYPEGYHVPEAKPRSYDDRTLFWKLQYRGELRRKILAYARERDLLHPEDLGTMTHWYSRTPCQYLDKVKPDFMPQVTAGYGQETGKVWDIRQEKNLEAYWKLTETHIREYGSPTIFHTIGLAERQCYHDRESNQQMKLYTYRRIQAKLREHYPNAPLLIGTWDFSMYWKPEEVRELVKQLNPQNTIVFDYTSDTDDELRTFQNWDLCGKFPWIYGIFHAYEPDTEPRGNYDAIERRLPIAVQDPMCKGMVLWPENSHADTLMLEYLAANAWNPEPENIAIHSFVNTFCNRRYQGDMVQTMTTVWQQALPFIKANFWNGPVADRRLYRLFSSICFKPKNFLFSNERVIVSQAYYNHGRLGELVKQAPALLRQLAALPLTDPQSFQVRDAVDLTRTIALRANWEAYNRLIILFERWRGGEDNAAEILPLLQLIRDSEVIFAKILAAQQEYSLYASLLDLQAKHECNPDFEPTLKGNASDHYCRSCTTELFNRLYLPEFDVCANAYRKLIGAGQHQLKVDWSPYNQDFQNILDAFFATPLKDMAPDADKAFRQLPQNLGDLADVFQKLFAPEQA